MADNNSTDQRFRRGLDADFMARLKELVDQRTWFADVLKDPDLVLGIRDNYVNVYWHGQSLFKIDRAGGKLTVSTHPKYLVDPDLSKPVTFTGSTFETDGIRPLIGEYKPGTLDRMKRAARLYCGREKKGVQAVILANQNVVDTEIAFPKGSDDERQSVPRIDLAAFVRCPDGLKLRFWEAKHFKNPGLRSREEVPVLAQIEKYQELIEKHRAEMEHSYREVTRNLVQLASWAGEKERVSDLVEMVENEEPFSIEQSPFVGLLIYGFDRAQQRDSRWQGHLTRLREGISCVVCAGDPKYISLKEVDKSAEAQRWISRPAASLHQNGSGSNLLAEEKRHQVAFRTKPLYFSEAARAGDGVYRGKERPFCLPVDCADENLYPDIRKSAIEYFKSARILWHDGQQGKPSNHLCDSQVSCVNFLFPLASDPVSLAQVFRPLFPNIREIFKIERDLYVGFEWIGQKEYLGERVPQSGKRTRGANCTSADAIVGFERTDGKRQIVLIEWKYTESYGGRSLKIASSGRDRSDIYRALLDRDDCPINRNLLGKHGSPSSDFDALFFEPFYQLMRQQLLAREMERARELDADVVSVLHIAPSVNRAFRTVTSPELRGIGDTAVDVWKKLVVPEGRFASISTEDLFRPVPDICPSNLQPWVEYMVARYPWLAQKRAAGA